MRPATRESYQERMLRVLVYLRDNLDRPLGLEELAGVACFSPHHFHRMFKGMVGESVAGHIRRLRLERAAVALRQSRRSVTDIGLEAGYENLESFTRAFHTAFGVPPSQYRERFPGEAQNRNGSHGRYQFKSREEFGMDVNIVKHEPEMVAFVNHVGPYENCGEAWGKLCAWAGPKGLLAGSPCFLGLCHDDPEVTPKEKVRYDACLVVKGAVEPQGEVGVQTIPGGDFAVTLHKGPFEKLHLTYAALCGGWLPGSGREIAAGPSMEIYLNDPETTPPEELLVEIRVPLE